ncbi:DUF397 domain-containing protein [Marinactinospora thermotolerans]|uniref:DUF397 domain-containing protein n=1 Tax=Marinactinospora thermotolerans DSM 45154 TaxID=1122192 RepID=A0A1T4SXM1_9ACTN|nr:DUF397 domain-containing protein [Marinactinospora thermotolerans]SKA32651.1 protein of unknown function [Marinactinospora thermotolerans DSM 45154]
MNISHSHSMKFRKSSYSQAKTQNCVEVADLPGAQAVRDSQNPDLGHLTFPAAEMAAFLDAVKTGRL